MAYVTQERNRGATIAAVGAVHAVVIYALVTGLAGPVWTIIKDRPLVGVNVPLPKAPPTADDPTPQPTSAPQHRGNSSDVPQGGTTTTTTTFDFGKATEGASGGAGTDEVLPPFHPIDPQPDPTPTFTPKLARPIGKPGLWVTPNDYPSNDLRAEHEGTTRFQLGIGTDGKVQSCEITVSSGFASLDKAACDNLRKRGKFTAATGSNGTVVPGTYASAVQWKIPKDY